MSNFVNFNYVGREIAISIDHVSCVESIDDKATAVYFGGFQDDNKIVLDYPYSEVCRKLRMSHD